MSRVSRLYRTFKPGSAGLFEIVAGDTTFRDDSISSITIKRGTSGPHPTVTPSTCEFVVTGAVNIPRNAPLSVRTSPAFGSALAAASPITGGAVRQRFNGRKAIAEVDDQRWRAAPGVTTRWATSVTASSWTSLLRNADRSNTASKGSRTGSVVVTALKHPDIEPVQPVAYSTLTKFDTVAIADPGLRFNDVMSKYADDLHTLVQHQRSGTVRVISNVQRRDDLNATTPVWTILRAHSLSPARWSAPSEVATTQYRVRYTTSTDVPYEIEWPLSEDVTVLPLKSETVDLTQIKRDTESLDLNMNARNRTTNVARMGVESVTLDLGLLWRIGTPSALRTVAEALRMEAGDPVHLGADWPQAVRGPYFANEISEDITPDSWLITFTLHHARYVLGLDDDELPTPPAITWDATILPWNTYPGPWG